MTVDSSGNIVPVTPGGGGDPVQITIGDVDGLQAALNGKEPSITAGTTAQYFRGDKTWQTLNKSAVGLGNVPNVTTNNQTPTYSAASTRTNLTSGETLATALGKIKKWFTDLKTVAFTGSYDDLSDTPTVPTKMSDLVNDSGYITGTDVPEGSAASTTIPKMDGTAAVGSETAFARGDHVHPTDTSRAPASPTYSTASSRTALTSGESLSTALGKIKKWLGDLGTLAFKSSVSKTDLESSVQTSLGKADSALQEHQSLAAYRTAAAQDVIDAGKQAMLTAGENITIVGNVISASGGGGGNEMTVFTMGTATYAQIKAAYDTGKDIVVHYETDNYYMPLTRYMPDANGGTFYFACWLSTGARYTSISNYRGWSSNVPASITPVSSSTLTANGDMFIRSSGSVTRLGIGTESQVLTVVDGLPAWQDLETYDGDVEYLTAYAGGVH